MKKYFWLVLFIPLLCSKVAFAGMISGNFYVDFTDYVSPDAKVLISRTFNSKGQQVGLYGNHWGSSFESYLGISGDGVAVVHENGTGRAEVFHSSEMNQFTIQLVINKIITAMQKDGKISTDALLKRYRNAMKGDKFREHWWTYYVNKGVFAAKSIAVGTIFHAVNHSFGQQRLVCTKAGFTRYSNLDTNKFNKQGKIIEHVSLLRSDSERHDKVKYYRAPDGLLLAVSDNDGESLLFVRRNHAGHITALMDKHAVFRSEYKYQNGNLIWSKGDGQHIYKYAYNENNQMTMITYQNGGKKVIEYADNGRAIREFYLKK